jgi:hypothetical protein
MNTTRDSKKIIWKMSLKVVKEYFAEYNMEHHIMVLKHSTTTVEEAAQAHGVDSD